MRRPRGDNTAAFKEKVAASSLKGDKTLVERAKKCEVHANQIVQEKMQSLKKTIGVFLTPAEKREAEEKDRA